MLLQFNVTNVFSFKNEAILDLVASSDTSHEESLLQADRNKVLPVAAIYGANAAGKSNLFKALTSAIMFVRNSQSMQVDTPIGFIPFLLDDTSDQEKTRIDFVFTRKGIKYEYGFVVDATKVYEEYLYTYKSKKPTKIFERYDVNHYKYTSSKEKVLKQYEEKNTDNKLFLATATAWNCQETKEPYLWFAEGIDTYNPKSIKRDMLRYLELDSKKQNKEYLVKALKVADFNISDYMFTSKERDAASIQPPPGMKFDENIKPHFKEWDLKYAHDVEIDDETKRYSLPSQLESSGTLSFTAYSLIIHDVLENGKTMVVDEIDNGLHPMLLQHIVEMFADPAINRNGAQLIFNTHAVTLLDLDMLRRDQIFFAEKDNKTGESSLYSMADFTPMPRKTDKILKRYMQGRYGAIPEIGEE